MTQKCLTFTGRHRFEPRYDERPVRERGQPSAFEREFGPSMFGRRVFTRKTYVHSVCRHCGQVVERREPTP